MIKDSKILVTGSTGMVGHSLVSELKKRGYTNLLLPDMNKIDLRVQKQVNDYFKKEAPEFVFHLAAKVGGISANIASPGGFLYDNLMIVSNVINSAKEYNTKKLLYLGSSCVYPKECKQPMREEDLLSGKLEPTNEGYALAKIAGLKMCEYYNKQYNTNFICLMPCNLYGPYDTFDIKKSHVISSLLLKFHSAKKNKDAVVEIWGSGMARRELLYVDDVAFAMVYFMEKYDASDLPPFINIGLGEDISISELAEMVKDITMFKGKMYFDKTKPEGMMKKLLDISEAKTFGWVPKTSLRDGIEKTYQWFLENEKN